jgi:hypothetical protein
MATLHFSTTACFSLEDENEEEEKGQVEEKEKEKGKAVDKLSMQT